MFGRMMSYALTLTCFLERARTQFADTEVVTRRPDKSVHRLTYAQLYRRTCRLANALASLGVDRGSSVATLCWNHHQHLEVYLGVPAYGAVAHTLNPRLHPTELGYIARHAGDTVLVVDESLLPLFGEFAADVPSIEHVIVVSDGEPAPLAGGMLNYETLLEAESEETRFPELDENAAAMICYTSGTTGAPKGVVYSHRSTVLHALVLAMNDTFGVSEADTILPIVPMFHAAAWCLPYAAVMCGARVAFPGPHMDPTSLLDLMAEERVTVAAGVPTVWIGILARLDAEPKRWDLGSMRSAVIGGAAAPAALIDGLEQRHGLHVTPTWGMTEINPVGTIARLKRSQRAGSEERKREARATQGYANLLLEMRHRDESGAVLPWDGVQMGELEVRGPSVAASYMGGAGEDRFTADGWFKTGDVVTIDPDGYMRITDRAKDVIKSGGEWISSVALENALMSHPAVLEAAVFAGRHKKWSERPLAAVVFKDGQKAGNEELAAHLEPLFAKYWLPDDYLIVESIPRTSTGKFQKTRLRELYGDHLLG